MLVGLCQTRRTKQSSVERVSLAKHTSGLVAEIYDLYRQEEKKALLEAICLI